MPKRNKIAVIGLGYVGLPLAIAFGEKFNTIGFDIDKTRISELKNKYDRTREIDEDEFDAANLITFSDEEKEIKDCNIYILTVPTPINKLNQPDLSHLKNACHIVGKCLSSGDIVVIESTVYPEATEEVCVPILSKESRLNYINEANDYLEDGFYCAYSPERINPGDKENRLTSIKKIVSGSTKSTLDIIDALYSSIIKAGVVRAKSIKAAEAAKVIENTQRDLNIALINEFALIFDKLDIDTEEVLRIASTKWNFTSLKPGLVGGHCIGVDPYYLAHKAIEADYYPELILAGRKLNNYMGIHVADQVIKLMIRRNIQVPKSNVLVMGFTFKENCPDVRNTRIIDIIDQLKEYKCNVNVFDPVADKYETSKEYNVELIEVPEKNKYDAIILAVNHLEFSNIGIKKIKEYGLDKHIIYDVKYVFDYNEVDGRL